MFNPPQIYASGKHVKFTRSFTGDASDWLYRKEVKSLMDDIIVTLLLRKLLLIFFIRQMESVILRILAAT